MIEVAIVRPGPDPGRHGASVPARGGRASEPVTYPSDAVKGVLERTLGVPIFQEQVMQLAIVAAGFTPGEADQLRRSMAAWRRKGGLEKFEQRLIDGMGARGYDEAFARQIYQQILGFGEYGFPESHSASFALLVYVSSWLKHYEPAAFCGALLNSQPMGFYAPAQLVGDARRHGVDVRPPDVTVSDWDCTLEKRGRSCRQTATPNRRRHSPRYARAAARPAHGRGLTEAARSASSPRGATRAFAERRRPRASRGARPARPRARSPTPMRSRRSPAIATTRCGTSPASSGCRRCSPAARSTRRARIAVADRRPGHRRRLPPPRPHAAPASAGAAARASLRERRLATAAEISAAPHGRLVRTAGIVIGRQRPDTASGVVFVTLEDETGATNVIVWRDLGDRQRRELLGARLLGVYGKVEREGAVVHVLAGRLVDLTPLLGTLPTRSRDFH